MGMTTTIPILGETMDEPPGKLPKPAIFKFYDYR